MTAAAELLKHLRCRRRIAQPVVMVVAHLRPVPLCDYTQPPNPGVLDDERSSWGMDGSSWRSQAMSAAEPALCRD